MSLDKFVKTDKKNDGEKGPEKPAKKTFAAGDTKPEKLSKKAPSKKIAKSAPVNAEGAGEIESPPQNEGEQAGVAEGSPAIPRGVILKAMGLEKYVLSCPACKFKKELHVSGDLKPHQLLCKKCGGTMRASKKA
ncbi:MAG: hypothetical protein Q6373_023925 [Candidatus Sigynarchaeota archaeon]